MQTIKVTTRTDAQSGAIVFSINGVSIAHVEADFYYPGRYAGRIDRMGLFPGCNNCTLPDAVEFIGSAISNHFESFGLAVEFVAD